MSRHTWQLEANRATLVAEDFSAVLDFVQPALGLHHIRWRHESIPNARLLGVHWGEVNAAQPRVTSDCYVRGGDVIVTYAEQPQTPFSPQVYWRAVDAIADSEAPGATGFELLVSVQTRVLDAQPKMWATTKMPAAEILHLEDTEKGAYASIAPGKSRIIDPAGGTGCLLLRLPNGRHSYVEMVHPHDFLQGGLTVASDADSFLLSHTLIACPMEKGVIIRTRVRSCFLDRVDDLNVAARLYKEFAGAALPLSA